VWVVEQTDAGAVDIVLRQPARGAALYGGIGGRIGGRIGRAMGILPATPVARQASGPRKRA
jgi:hypothetical protein